MTANTPVKAISAGELVKLRAENQAADLGLHIQRPATVYTMRVNGTPASNDRIASLTYDGGSGTYTAALAGMTVLVSVTAYGKHDKGICRLRKDLPSATTGDISISETSAIQFADDDYLTVINAFSIWQKDIAIEGASLKMDYDIEFGSYLLGGITPRIAPIRAVVNQTSGTITFTPPSPALSAGYDGATIASYQYTADGASTTSNMTSGTGTASWTYPLTANTEYRWSCAITDSLGRVTTSYRWVVVNPTSQTFELTSCATNDSGWSYKVRVRSDDLSGIYDRAMVTLYTSFESYGGVAGAIGKLAGYENIINTGWIDGKTINVNQVEGYAEFEVKDAAFWLSEVRALSFSVYDTSSVPVSFQEIASLTIDKALHNLLFWRSTALQVMDCFYTGDTKRVKELTSPSDNLLAQISDVAMTKIFARPIVNSLGQLFVEVDPNMLSTSDQNSIIEPLAITKADYQDGFEINISNPETSLIDVSGVSVWNGSYDAALYSKAPGNTPSAFGSGASSENLLFANQEDCNRIAGLLYAVQNNKYETLDLQLAGQNKFIDIAPNQFVRFTIAAADNPLGVALSNVRAMPRSLEYSITAGGALSISASFEFLINDVQPVYDGVTYIPPETVEEDLNDNYADTEMDFPSFPKSSLGNYFPPLIPPPVVIPGCNNLNVNSRVLAWDKSEIRGDGTLVSRVYLPCRIHGDIGAYYKTSIGGWTALGDAAGHYTVYGIKDGSRVITGTIESGEAVFYSSSTVDVDGFEIELEAGLGDIVSYIAGDAIASGTVQANDETGISVPTVIGAYYAVDGIGLWWSGVSNAHGCRFKELDSLFAEDLSSISSRRYYKATSTTHNVTVNDYIYSDNSGSSAYIARNASIYGRRIVLNSATIKNICPTG